MDQALRVILLLAVAGLMMTLCALVSAWWLEPSRRVQRRLAAMLGGPVDAAVAAPVRGQGAGISFDARQIAVLRDLHDAGLVYELDELVGAELIFDGQVAARAIRGEQRRPLDHIDPQARRVTLRLVFDDPRDPDVDLDLWAADDPERNNWDGPTAVQAARKFFARVEALARR